MQARLCYRLSLDLRYTCATLKLFYTMRHNYLVKSIIESIRNITCAYYTFYMRTLACSALILHIRTSSTRAHSYTFYMRTLVHVLYEHSRTSTTCTHSCTFYMYQKDVLMARLHSSTTRFLISCTLQPT